MNRKKIVITGGPGTGKTSIINELKNQNYHCFEEIIRSLTVEAKKEKEDSTHSSNPIAFVNNPLDFNTRLLNGRLNQFEQAAIIEKPLIFFDRGIPDVLAYMSFFNQSYSEDFLNVCLNHKYNHVFLLPPWESIYEVDNELRCKTNTKQGYDTVTENDCLDLSFPTSTTRRGRVTKGKSPCLIPSSINAFVVLQTSLSNCA